MKTKLPEVPALARLPTLIERDIRERRLRAGDRYMTAKQVGRLFGVSTMTANRAMQELAARKVLARSQRSGTFIGVGVKLAEPISLKCVHLLLPADYFRLDKPYFDRIVSGIHSELPEDALQFTFVPAQGDLAFVRELVDSAREAGLRGGYVLFLSSPQVQRYFQETRLPAIVSGSVYPDVTTLCWIDRDQREVGRLLTAAALLRGHRRLAVLMRERWGFGDNLLIDGVHQALSEAKVGFDALTVRSLPWDPDLISSAVRALLTAKDKPTALLCRSAMAADTVAETARELRLPVPKGVQIFLADYYQEPRKEPRYVHAEPQMSPEEHGAALARMLKTLAQGRRPDPDHQLVPVTIRDPGQA